MWNSVCSDDFFDDFCKKIKSTSKIKKRSKSKAILKIAQSDSNLLGSIFGDFGFKMYDFFNAMDYDHPDIYGCYDNAFADGGEFSRFVCEAISCGKYIKKNNLNHMSSIISEYAKNKMISGNKLIEFFDVPENNRKHVRFLSDKSRLDSIRKKRTPQFIDMCGIYKKGINFYDGHADNFSSYMRFNKTLSLDVKNLEEMVKIFENIGCNVLAQETKNSISLCNEYIDQTYYGFNRISISAASIILAKSIGFLPNSDNNSNEFTLNIKGNFYSNIIGSYEYEPIIYPIHFFENNMSENIKNVIYTLDNFPEAKDKPIFDFYGVIIPSVKIKNSVSYSPILDGHLNENTYANYSKLDFDRKIISDRLVDSVIIAEKDHRCYFITYWV